jgi:carbon storage regulator
VLRRRVGESIVIHGDVEVEIIEISRTRVKLGVAAPREISVVRKETIPVAAENRKAAELLASRGQAGIEGILQVLRAATLAEGLPIGGDSKESSGLADKTDSIPERGNRE